MKRTPKTNLSAELKDHCERLGLSQSDFAERCGVSQAAMSKWMARKKSPEPKLPTLRKIATAIGRKLNFGDSDGKIFG